METDINMSDWTRIEGSRVSFTLATVRGDLEWNLSDHCRVYADENLGRYHVGWKVNANDSLSILLKLPTGSSGKLEIGQPYVLFENEEDAVLFRLFL